MIGFLAPGDERTDTDIILLPHRASSRQTQGTLEAAGQVRIVLAAQERRPTGLPTREAPLSVRMLSTQATLEHDISLTDNGAGTRRRPAKLVGSPLARSLAGGNVGSMQRSLPVCDDLDRGPRR